MRLAFQEQLHLDCPPVAAVPLNLNCRDEIIPILRALQHVYEQAPLRSELLDLIGNDVNPDTSPDHGREGLSYWEIMVLAAVRLGCNFDYDKLQDLAEQHRTLRLIMGIGDWDDQTNFDWRRIRDNLCLLGPPTLEKINQAIVAAGHEQAPAAIKTVRGDTFVVETNVDHPCIPKKGRLSGRRQQEGAGVEFRQARQSHPGVESAIGALQSGNGQERCRDQSKLGYERYVGLGIPGRNLQVLGKLLLAQDDAQCEAAKSKRKQESG